MVVRVRRDARDTIIKWYSQSYKLIVWLRFIPPSEDTSASSQRDECSFGLRLTL